MFDLAADVPGMEFRVARDPAGRHGGGRRGGSAGPSAWRLAEETIAASARPPDRPRRTMTERLFEGEARDVPLAPGAMLLGGFVNPLESQLVVALQQVSQAAPFRHMITPAGRRMSVAMSNCGAVGWVSDRSGYRYEPSDPESGRPWPDMPAVFRELATEAAARAGFAGFAPDACLVNRYEPGTRLSLHQDRDEQDLDAPIVSVSLGLPAVFLFGGLRRADALRRLRLTHGDVVVWGGPSRLRYHGVAPLADGRHPLLGGCRINLTFRKAL